jgi:hypothetical protein
MEIKKCNRNPYFLADFVYEGSFSDRNPFYLRIPEKDVIEFCNTLLKAYQDDMDGKIEVIPPYVYVTDNGNVFYDGEVIIKEE